MKKRIKGLKAIVLAVVMIAELFGVDAIRAVAETFYISEDTTIDADTADSYSMSGAKLTVNEGVKVTGTVYGSGATVENYGDISQADFYAGEIHNYVGASIGAIVADSSNINIQNEGIITTLDDFKGNVTNTGTIGNIIINNSDTYNPPIINMNGGTITSLKSYVEKVDDASAPQLILNGGTITSLESNGGLVVNAAGASTIGTLSGEVTFAGSGTINVSNTLNLTGDYSSVSPVLKVSDSTQINMSDGSKLKVQYEGRDYILTDANQGSLREIVGNTIACNIEDESTINLSNSISFSKTQKYMPGQEITATYSVADGYYFPVDYAAVTDGSGVVKTTRIDAKTISVSYTVENSQNKLINITLPKASKRTAQSAPVGLTGGIEAVSGLTESMEYANASDAAAWTPCTAETMNFTAGTWYFRYKETDDKYASEAAAVVVLEKQMPIQYIEAPSPAYYISGTKGENGYYVSDVKITAPNGYKLSDSENGSYRDSITINEQSTLANIYLMRVADGLKTKAVSVGAVAIDTVMPVVDVQNNQTYYGNTFQISIYDKHLKEIYVNGVIEEGNGTSRVLNLDSDNGICDYEIKAIDLAGNSITINIKVAAEWMRNGIIPKGKAVKLISGNAYKLGAGTWKVSGDETTYNGNITFYVGTEGSYMFNEQ